MHLINAYMEELNRQIDRSISKALFYNSHHDSIPEEVVVANCLAAGISEEQCKSRLDELVENGTYQREDGRYSTVNR